MKDFGIKQKTEKFDINTLKPFDKILVRDTDNECWACGLFSYINKTNDTNFPIICISNRYEYCIPYNEETKHLLGTKYDCPEYYKWWK